MSLPYFYCPRLPTQPQAHVLAEETSKHIVQVLRMKVGEALRLTNGKGLLAEATILDPHKKNTQVQIHDTRQTPAPAMGTIAVSLVKHPARFEWFLEKATELGVGSIVPIRSQRTEKDHFRFERMVGILVSAMLQSQQSYLPDLQNPIELDTFLEQDSYPQKFIAHCLDGEKRWLHDIQPKPGVCVLIGPEGDFTSQEITRALEKGYQPISLGNTRLRTETAGMAVAVWMQQLHAAY